MEENQEDNIIRKKSVDESWKDEVVSEKERIQETETDPASTDPDDAQGQIEVTFLNYISSLVFQAMIFLGELPNPVDGNKIEKNLKQAKFLIDTISIIRDKTKGNLSKEEDELLNSALYELQMKYVDQIKGTKEINEQG